MGVLRIKQTKSQIRRSNSQKRTLKALGLRGINKVVQHEDTPSILGMIDTVSHLVLVEKL